MGTAKFVTAHVFYIIVLAMYSMRRGVVRQSCVMLVAVSFRQESGTSQLRIDVYLVTMANQIGLCIGVRSYVFACAYLALCF